MNTTRGMQEEINHRIKRPQVRDFEPKAASKEKQKAFDILNKWQGKKYYLLAVKIEQDKLINGLK